MPDNDQKSALNVVADQRRALEQHNEALKQVCDALVDANDVCRSAYQMIQRRGENVNWEALEKRVKTSLDRQHAVIHGKV